MRSDSLKSFGELREGTKNGAGKRKECAKQTDVEAKASRNRKRRTTAQRKVPIGDCRASGRNNIETNRCDDGKTRSREDLDESVRERKKAKTAAMIDNNNDKKDDKEMPNVETPPLLQQLQPRQQQIRRQNMTTSLKCGKGRKLCFGCSAVVGSPTRVCPYCKTTLPRVAALFVVAHPNPVTASKSLEPPPSSSPPPSPPLSLRH